MIKKFFAVICMMMIPAGAFCLDLQEGKIKLVLHESSGRFSAYYREDISSNNFNPLFVKDDPRTTFLAILADNVVYKMGEDSSFKQTLEETSDGGQFVWESAYYRVTQHFSFVRSPGSTLSDGFSLKITVENISEGTRKIGIAFLVDTFLGEDDGVHFRTDRTDRVKNEQEFLKADMPEYWLSPFDEDAEEPAGFQGILNNKNIDVPDRIILGNWKRLNDNIWNYNHSASRNFNLLPYSINDSAVAVYYFPVSLDAAASVEKVLHFGLFSEDGFSTSGGTELSNLANSVSGNSSDDEHTLMEDLTAVKDLLNRIDAILNSGEEINDDTIEVLSELLQALEDRKSQYTK